MKFFLTLLTGLLLITLSLNAQNRPEADELKTSDGSLTIQPIHHGSLVLNWNKKNIYVDPVGDMSRYEGLGAADLVLITHAHPDHMDPNTLKALDTSEATIVVPKSVAKKMPSPFEEQLTILSNGDDSEFGDISIHAVPMYNLPQGPDTYHPKDRGNGYILEMGGKNIYISGDTEDIKEMRSLKNIDLAFVCMNLPYTMDVKQAASGVIDFKPAIIYPYHYKGQDTQEFKKMVNQENDDIDVRLRDWYME